MVDTTEPSIIAPKELIVPVVSGAEVLQPVRIGALYISGIKLFFSDGTGVPQLITSA